jgi:dTDP-4-dehydrorhamnose 3,5-epimerase
MPIKIEETTIAEIKIVATSRFYDDRGFFSETYKEKEYNELGFPKFVQDNLSESSRGVIRGLHWQDVPFGQGKLVSCTFGSIYDVAVDIRPNSPTFGNHVAVELRASEGKSLWIPEGFAHGFQALEDGTRVVYKVTNYWKTESERALNPLDLELEINWPVKKYKMSRKDSEAITFSSMFKKHL